MIEQLRDKIKAYDYHVSILGIAGFYVVEFIASSCAFGFKILVLFAWTLAVVKETAKFVIQYPELFIK